MARPIPTDGQQVLRQLVKDVDYLKRTTATIQTLNATTGVQEETVYVSDPNGPPGSVTIGDVPLNEYVQAPGEVFDGDKETVTEGDKIWLVVPSAPICSTNQQAVTVTWDGFGAGGEDIPPNFGVLEIHRSLDEVFDVFDPELAGTTLVGVLTYPGSIVFTNQMYDTPYYYRFIMRAADGRRSGQSAATLGIAELTGASDIDPVVFDDINESIATAQETADNAIASYAPEYAVSASDTVAPTTGWSTTTPVRTPGTYIWYRTTVTYGNGATSTTNPALLTGNDGAPGAPGTPAAVITLTATTQILAAPAGGGATTPATSVVTGVATNTTITAWTYSVDGAAFSATVPPGVSRTANVVTITGSTMTAKTIAVRMSDAGTVSDTLTVAKVTEGSTGGTGPQGPAGPAGADAYTILLSNEAQTFAAGTTNALAGSATTTVLAYKGSVAQVAHVGTITGGATGITAAITANDTTAPVVTFTVTTALTAANGTFTIPVSVAGGPAVPQIFTWSLAFAGAPGATGGTGPQGPSGTAGAPAADISLTATTQILSVAAGGAITPTTSVVTGTATNTTITAWTYSVDGAAFSGTVPPGVSRTANVVTITGSTMTAKTIAVRMADAGTAVDTYTVAKVSDGATGGTGAQGPAGGTGAAGADGLTVLLSNEAATIAADTTKAIATTITSTVIAYKGTTQQSALVGTITGGAAGISAAVTNNPSTAPLITFTVTTALVAPNGTFTIPVTVAGVTVNQVFSWSLSFAGPAGGTGSQGPAGAPASIVDLVTTTQVLTSPAAGGATTPATAVLTGTATNTTIASWSYSVDGGTFTGTPPTGLVLAGNVVTITGATMTAKTIAVRATGASGVTDTITVAKNYDGATGGTGAPGGTGPAGADAYTVLLTNEAQVFPGTVAAAIAGSATTSVLAYKATTAQTATIGTITGQATGLTTAITNNGTTTPLVTITVTTSLTTGGTLTIPVTVGGIVFTKLFSWSVSFAGATGATGGTGPTGISVTSVTPYFYQVTTGAAAPALPTVSPPPAPWSATEPTYAPNTELYRTERVLYSSGPPQYTTVTKVSSYAAATAAMASANGKNQIIYSTSDASGTSFNGIPFIDGDTWFKYRTDVTPQTVSAQWRYLTGAWVSQKVDGANLAYLDAGTITTGYLDVANRINAGTIHSSKIQTDTITALQIAADAITASEIQAGAITAEKIALGVLRRNLIFDGSFEDSYAFTNWDPFTTGQGNTAQWRNAPGGSTAGLGPVRDTTGKRTRSGNNAVNLTVGAGQVATMISNTFPTIVGQTYRLVVNACSLTALANMVVDVQVADVIGGIDGFNPITITGDTGWVLSPPVGTEPLDASEFTTYSWTFVATKAFAALRIGNNAPSAACTLVVDDVSVVLTGVGGASELTAAGLRLFNNDGMEVSALVSNRSNYFTVSGVGGQTLASVDADGSASFQNVEVRGQSDLLPIFAYTHLSNVVTAFTTIPHGYDVGDLIFVSGLSAAANGAATVLDAPAPSTFTYSKTGTGVNYTVAPDGASVNPGTVLSDGQVRTGLTIYGADFADYIDRLPKGQIAYGARTTLSAYTSTTVEQGYQMLNFHAEQGRLYRIRTSGQIGTDISGARGVAKLRYTTNGTDATVTSTQMASQASTASTSTTASTRFEIHRSYSTSAVGGQDISLLTTIQGNTTGQARITATSTEPQEMEVIDHGFYPGDTGNDMTVTTPPPTSKTYTATYTSTTAKSYTGTGAADASQGEQDMKQGYSSYDGDSKSLWIFPTFTGAVGANSISKVRLYLYANHWYYTSGGTALIKVHGYAVTAPGSSPGMATLTSSASWPKPGGRWVTLPNSTFTFNSVSSTFYAHLIAGRIKGFGVGPAGNQNLLYYGRFNKTGAKVEITYTR